MQYIILSGKSRLAEEKEKRSEPDERERSTLHCGRISEAQAAEMIRRLIQEYRNPVLLVLSIP